METWTTTDFRFAVSVSGKLRRESEIHENFEDYRAPLLDEVKKGDLEGILILRPKGSPELAVDDSLCALTKNFCFTGIAELASTNRTFYDCFTSTAALECTSAEGSISIREGLKVVEDGQHVFQSRTGSIEFPRDEFLAGLFRCGLRFVEVLERLAASDCDGANSARILRESLGSSSATAEILSGMGVLQTPVDGGVA